MIKSPSSSNIWSVVGSFDSAMESDYVARTYEVYGIINGES